MARTRFLNEQEARVIFDTYKKVDAIDPDVNWKVSKEYENMDWEKVCREGNDEKYGRFMVNHENKLRRGLTFGEFYGGSVVD